MKTNWLHASSKQGFIAYDFNKNGKIDSGVELFGNHTNGKIYDDGYEAIAAEFDKDKNGILTPEEMHGLLFWSDLNGDGISQENELSSLTEDHSVIVIVLKGLDRDESTGKMLLDNAYAYPYSTGNVVYIEQGEVKTTASYDIWFESSEK
ncbi:MAG: hypothetical protein SFT81_06520 [Candidatus Caenarcaniphilales bacterium]|nr:hypothetical protein [Candidatus Caenarcaniphilales bacterium]